MAGLQQILMVNQESVITDNELESLGESFVKVSIEDGEDQEYDQELVASFEHVTRADAKEIYISAKKAAAIAAQVEGDVCHEIDVQVAHHKITQEQAAQSKQVVVEDLAPLQSKTLISGFSQEKLKRMANFSKLCYFRNIEKSDQIGYAKRNSALQADGFKAIPDLIEDGYKVVAFTNKFQEAGYLFCKENEVTIAYRGTKTVKDHMTDANCMFATPSFMDKGRVHSGFYNSFESSWDNVYCELDAYAQKTGQEVKDLSINVTGHSMGGAVAKIAALRLKNVSKVADVNVATFGDPRVFDLIGSQVYNDQLADKTVRVTQYRQDPVPAMSPGSFGYSHVGAQLRIDVHHQHKPHQMDGYLKTINALKPEEFAAKDSVSLFYYPSKLLQYLNAYTIGAVQNFFGQASKVIFKPEKNWVENILAERKETVQQTARAV